MTQPKNATAQPDLDRFLDIAGHELRNPIAALKGQVQLLQRRLRKADGRERDLADLDKMLYQIERLNAEVDIYLAAAHIAKRRLKVLPEPLDLVTIVERLVGIYAAGAAGHAISLDCSAECIFGKYDKRRIEQALGVLLNNALKYSPSGEILVRLGAENGIARLEVLDHGVGVPPKERARIFQQYTHGSNVENAGAGLGLYVARVLIRRHGGRMGVQPRPDADGGSIFWIELPAQLAGADQGDSRVTAELLAIGVAAPREERRKRRRAIGPLGSP